MDRDKLIRKEKKEQEAIRKKEEDFKKEAEEEEDEYENTGVKTILRIKDGGNIYSDTTGNYIIKRVIIVFKNKNIHLELETEVNSLYQKVDSKEFLILYGFYLDFLNPKSYKKLIDALNLEIAKLFI